MWGYLDRVLSLQRSLLTFTPCGGMIRNHPCEILRRSSPSQACIRKKKSEVPVPVTFVPRGLFSYPPPPGSSVLHHVDSFTCVSRQQRSHPKPSIHQPPPKPWIDVNRHKVNKDSPVGKNDSSLGIVVPKADQNSFVATSGLWEARLPATPHGFDHGHWIVISPAALR